MGNSASAGASQQQQHVNQHTSHNKGVSGAPQGARERDQASAVVTSIGHDGRQSATTRYVSTSGSSPQQRIVVDIRSAQLDKDYKVYITQEPRRDLDADLRSAWNGLQAVGGLLITILTIQKLWEDIRFIRVLRRELSTIVGSLTDAGGGAEAGGGDAAAGTRPTRPHGASGSGGGARPGAASAPGGGGGPGGLGRHLDLNLAELSDILNGTRGTGAAAAAAGTAAGGGAGAVAAPGGHGGAHQGQGQAQVADGGGARVAHKETTWSSISGLTDVKILLQEATVLPTLRPDLFQGIRQPPKALLLFGPPGTGKTLLARAVATESRATFLPVTGSSVLSMWYGQSEQNVKALFEKARRRQPAIIFIDEVDSLLGKRSAGGPRDSTPDKRVTNEFLAFIDGIQTQQAGPGTAGGGSGGADGGSGGGGGHAGDTRVVVIAATNTPWDLDEAALSRFSRRIYVPLPDRATREALMRKAMEGVNCAISDEEWQRLAERCDKYSGRDLVQVCREAAMRPLRELWGKRLLEGSAAAATGAAAVASQHAAAQQRLVDLVVKSLAGAAGAAGSGQQQQQQEQQETAAGTAADVAPAAAAAAQPDGQGAAAAAGPGRQESAEGSGGTAGTTAEGAAEGAAGGAGGGGGGAGRARWGWRWRWGGLGGDRYTVCRKQARRELERWKRRHGASWCDVDAVMQQAEARIAQELRNSSNSTGSSSGSSGQQQNQSCQQEKGRQEQEQAQRQEEHGHGRRNGGAAQQGQGRRGVRRRRSGQGQPDDDGSAGTGTAAEQPASAATVAAVDTVGDSAAAGGQQPAAPAAGATTAERAGEGEGVGTRQEAPSDAPAVSGGSAAMPCGAVGSGGSAAVAAAADPDAAAVDTPMGEEAEEVTATPSGSNRGSAGGAADAASDSPARAAAVRAASEETASKGSGPQTGAGAAGTDAGQAAAATAAQSGHPAPPSKPPQPSSGGGGSGGNASPPRKATGKQPTAAAAAAASPSPPSAPLSLDDLLTLPVDRVRPVGAADMEAALQVISCTEMDQSARYTEWDDQYGSGATAAGRQGGGRGGPWMSMYA